MSGLVSTALEREVLGEMRRHGVVVWLDKDARYSRFVDDLAARHASGELPFPVVAFRGSFLDLLFALEPHGSGLTQHPLLIHMPGFTEESIRKTPVLELYEPGVRFRKALDTLVREVATARVAPAEVDRFLAGKPGETLTLEGADSWLGTAATESSIGLASLLQEVGPKLISEALVSTGSTLTTRAKAPDEVRVLRGYLHTLTGMDDAWIRDHGDERTRGTVEKLDDVMSALAAWILCVEYVHDLRRAPYLPELSRLRELSQPLVKQSCDLVAQLRRDNADAYARFADAGEVFLANELLQMTPEDLGQIDTFRIEDDRVLEGALAALLHGQWQKARTWWEARSGDRSFWLKREQPRRVEWSLVGEATELGAALSRHHRPFEHVTSLEEAADRYASDAFEVDRAHRRLEQRRLALLESSLRHFTELQECVETLRRAHRAWADQLAGDFARLCKDVGFLPPASHQQRTLFEQVVLPLVQNGEKVAVFLIDAFRYEMATELLGELGGAGTVVDLRPRFAELPTITSVGMNALAPVTQGGKLAVAGEFVGFKSGEFTVRSPEDRARAMGTRASGKAALRLSLSEVCSARTATLTKDVKPHSLIVVQSREIDDAGEANVGLATFESTLQQVRSAWHHLQRAGVKQCVFTADHGFLLQEDAAPDRAFGTKRSPKRRHVLDDLPRSETGMVNVSVSSLGYEGISGYLLFLDDTRIFATGNPGATFVHGGNSAQERIIPVLTVTRQRTEVPSVAQYAIETETCPDIAGLHRLRVRVMFAKETAASLGFATARTVDLALRVPGADAVRAVLKDAEGGTVHGDRLRLPVTESWTTLYFSLEGLVEARVRIEMHHPDQIERVKPMSPDALFDVGVAAIDARKRPSVPAPPLTSSPRPSSWSGTIEDPAFRRVFEHIEQHGAITETEVVTLLGSPRAFRRFSLEFDGYIARLPFRVRIEPGEGGKRYVREGEK